MTALNKFDRLESPGIWRPSEGAQSKNVIVSVGNATLTLSDTHDKVMAHWSLPAVERTNPGQRPAIYRPGQDADETLEISDNTMVKAIAKVQNAIEHRRPHPGRLRLGLSIALAMAVLSTAVFWLPGAMVEYTASVVPMSKRAAIGENLLANIRRVSGKLCDAELGQNSLSQLHKRLFGQGTGKIVVLSGSVQPILHLPGKIILLNRSLVEDHEEVDVVAGYLLAESIRAKSTDPLVRLLKEAGFGASFKLLTTGEISASVLESYSESLLVSEPKPISDSQLLEQFRAAGIRTSPYAYAIDISGEKTIGLIEADSKSDQELKPILKDSDWVSLQGICGE